MARSRRVAKSIRTRKSKPKADFAEEPQPQISKLRFSHLCHVCYVLMSCISELRPTIPVAYKNSLRFRRTFVQSKAKRCSFCILLFQSLSAHEIKVESGKLVRFILAVPGPEEDECIEWHDISALDLYWEGLIKPAHRNTDIRRLGSFMVSAIFGSPAAQYISNRPPIFDVVSMRSNDETRQWLQYCYSHHECCTSPKTSFTPTRIIDVGKLNSVPRLVEPNGHSGHYAALSNCWGGDQSVMATSGNIHAFYTKLPVLELQQTLRDAISTTRELGLQFLWIDSLCIIQDCKDDIGFELSRMHDVYANAYVTIVAASAKNRNEGFLHRRCQLPDDPKTVNFETFSLPYQFQDGTFDEVTLQPYQSFRPFSEPVNARAWTLQEVLLSPRLLIYGSQLVPQCFSSLTSAFGTQRISGTARLGATNPLQTSALGLAPRKSPFPTSEKPPQSGLDVDNHLQELQWYWSEIVNDYSERQITNVNDKLIAISGIARQLSTTAFKNHSYKAGLWLSNSPNKTSFLYDLCWTANCPSADPQPYLAPSWSWASCHGNPCSVVHMERLDSHTTIPGTGQLCEIVKCEVVTEREDPFSHIPGGSLTLQGIVREANVSSVKGSVSDFDIILSGQITMPSTLDRLVTLAAAFPSETVNLANADTTTPTVDYNSSFSAHFDTITPELRKDPGSVSVLCLRLVRNAGMLLTSISNQNFRRVGTFHYNGFLDLDDKENRVNGCFIGFPVTQITII